MDLDNLKIEICELPDEMELVKPTWRVYDAITGEDIVPVSDEVRIKAMQMMAFCANRIREALDYQRQSAVSSDPYLRDFLKKKSEQRLKESGMNPDVVFKDKK